MSGARLEGQHEQKREYQVDSFHSGKLRKIESEATEISGRTISPA
jgi:hypothetical protein